MAVACPGDLDTRKLRDEIQSIYARVASEPSSDFHFHRGPAPAAEILNYDRRLFDRLQQQSTTSFAGVANPHRIDQIDVGAMLLDIGWRRNGSTPGGQGCGKTGRAISVDRTESMRGKALAAARTAGL